MLLERIEKGGSNKRSNLNYWVTQRPNISTSLSGNYVNYVTNSINFNKSRNSKTFCIKKGVNYIHAFFPLWGGMYEDFVRTLKSRLKKILAEQRLNADELSTQLKEVEKMA